MKLPRAILADDHTLVAEALCGLMALRFDVVAIVADGHALISSATALKPDVIVVASGYVLKKSAASELIQAMEFALRGKSYITPQIARGMQESFIRNPQGAGHARSLTARQREVVQLLAEGKSMKEVASVLKVTPRTVAFHKYRVMQDLGFKTNADLIQFAVKNRIVVA